MRRLKKKILILSGVFVATLVVAAILNTHTSRDTTAEMQEATLPVIDIYYDNAQVNQLYGYVTQMNPLFMRDSITPVENNRMLPVTIHHWGKGVDAISYEIRSMDMERLVAEGEATNIQSANDTATAELKIQNIVDVDKEYLLVLELVQGKKKVYYYTRILRPSEEYLKYNLDFVMDFHNTSLNPEISGTLATYLEPDETADNTSLHEVTIHSSLRQVTWADFEGTVIGKPTVSVKEMNSDCNVVTLSYVMTAKDKDRGTIYYNVEEYYRMRYATERTYLLDYTRTMTEIFEGNETSISEEALSLGVRSKEVNYMSNSNGTAVAFEQEGDLWGYNQVTQKLTKIFSFRPDDLSTMDMRENYNQHAIDIINVEESGSVEFLVYGYMNRGTHEGKTGVSVCKYDSVTNTVEETLFIPNEASYQVMKEEVGKLAYQNNQDEFFLVSGNTLYQIDLDTMEAEKKKDGFADGNYAVSKSGRHIAYQADEESKTLCIEDLNTGDTHMLKAKDGEYIRPIAFMEEDLLCGLAKESGVITDSAGNKTYMMYAAQIMEEENDYQKAMDYYKPGYFITGAQALGNVLYLERVQRDGNGYVEAPGDTIINSEGKESNQIEIVQAESEKLQSITQILLSKDLQKKEVHRVVSKEIVHKDNREVKLQVSNIQPYYAYAAGKVIAATTVSGKAIREADAQMGVVLDQKQNYIWKRTKPARKEAIIKGEQNVTGKNAEVKALNIMFRYEDMNLDAVAIGYGKRTTVEVLRDAFKDYTVLDLTGCTVEQCLYYIGQGAPVLAKHDTMGSVLLVGYDSASLYVYQPTTAETVKIPREDAISQFEEAGNIFYSYLR